MMMASPRPYPPGWISCLSDGRMAGGGAVPGTPLVSLARGPGHSLQSEEQGPEAAGFLGGTISRVSLSVLLRPLWEAWPVPADTCGMAGWVAKHIRRGSW